MIKTLKQIKAQRKARFSIPRSLQEIMPISHIWEGGIFQHGARQFSVSYAFTDINYMIAGREERRRMYESYQVLLGVLGAGATYKITSNNRAIDLADFERKNFIPMRGDVQDVYREEYNHDLLREKLRDAAGICQENYITVTVFKPTYEEARAYFNRTTSSLQAAFGTLGSTLRQLTATDRLRILHDFFRPGEESRFHLDFAEAARLGNDLRDAFCPKAIERHSNYLKIGDKFARVLFAIDYASYVRDDMIARLCELQRNLMISVDVISIPTAEAVAEADRRRDGVEGSIARWQQRQNNRNNFSAVIPYPLARQREYMEAIQDDLNRNDQGLNAVTLTLVHMADTLEQLNLDTERLCAVPDCKLIPATFQQLDGLVTALPFGVCKIEAKRTLLTRCLAAVSMPFRVQEIREPGGIWFGENALSRNLLLCNRTNLQNQSMFILGIPGSGKSMFAKEYVIFIALATQACLLINDPEGEYVDLVRALGGTVISLRAGGDDHINPMDIVTGYGEKGGIVDKSEFIQTLFEDMNEAPLSAQELSIIDRCVLQLYTDNAGKTVTLMDLYALLKKQPEPASQNLALILERYTTGSLDIFSYETNVDLSNRIVCFNLRDMRQQLRPAGQKVIADFITNRVNVNAAMSIGTHVLTDEIQEFFKNPRSADFFESAWKQWRKRNACPIAVTQNVSVLMENEKSQTMVSNSETLVLMNQADADQAKLSEILKIPEEQMYYVRGADYGCGLLRYGKSIVPFVNRFPEHTKLYKLMTTKPDEGFTGGGAV